MPVSWTSPGARRRPITIQQQSATAKTAMGTLSGVWVTVLTTWAAVTTKQVIAPPTVQADQPIAKALFLLNIRYPPGIPILPGMRVSDGAAFYTIINVQDLEERHRELVLTCAQMPAPSALNQ